MKIVPKMLLIVLILTIVGSYLFSRELYVFYIKSYYTFTKHDINAMIENAKKLYKEKKHRKLEKYLSGVEIVYPDHADLNRIIGINYIALGKNKQGAEMILATIDKKGLPPKLLRVSLEILVKYELWGDIIATLKKIDPSHDAVQSYYYGVALYKIGDYKNAITWLLNAHTWGDDTTELYYFLGEAYNKNNNPDNARVYLEKAYKTNKRDKTVVRSLLNVYRKLKLYDQAHKIMNIRKEY